MSRPLSSPRLRSALFFLLPAILLVAGPSQAKVAIAYLAPVLLLVTILLADHYPGERLIRMPCSPPPARDEQDSAATPGEAEPRARRAPLLAFAEAGRAPPGSPRQTESFFDSTSTRRFQC